MRFVFKFGGSSLSSVEKIQKVATYIKEIKSRKDVELIVVVSAMGKTTNKLVSLADKISHNPYSTEYSSLISIGENISSAALALALEEIDVPSISLSSKDIQIHAKGKPTQALITSIDTHKIEHYLSLNKVVVVTGFQGINDEGQTLTLGRGGSDTTATALGAVLNAKVKIFTDVKGFFACDPNTCNDVKKLDSINIYSALELCSAGTKVLDNRSLEIANKNKLDLSILDTTSKEGTTISYTSLENYNIDGITHKSNLLFVKYAHKNSDFLQQIIENNNFKTYHLFRTYQNKSTQTHFISNITKQELNSLIIKNKTNLQCYSCDFVVITGSGLIFYPDILKKVQNILKINHFNYYFIDLSPTTLKICLNKNQSKKLEPILIEEFNLFSKEDKK